MQYKKYLKQNYFLLKSAGVSIFIPLVIIYIFLPFLNYSSYLKYGIGATLYNNIITYSQVFIPFFSTWWSILTLKEFVEGQGNEVLFVNTKRTHIFVCINFITFVFVLVPLYIVYFCLFDNMKLEFIKILIECILFNSISFAIMSFFRSVAISLTLPVIYTMYSFFRGYSSQGIDLSFISLNEATYEQLIDKYIPILLVSILLFVVTYRATPRTKSYQ